MAKRLGVVLSAVLLAACGALTTPSSSRTPVPGNDGSTWWDIRCHMDDDGCIRQIHLACPDGYVIKERKARKYFLIACTETAPVVSSAAPSESTAASDDDDDDDDGAKIKGRDSDSGVAFAYTVPSDWTTSKGAQGETICTSPKGTRSASMLMQSWGGTSREFAAKIVAEGDRYYDAKIAGRIAWMIESHPKEGGTATSAVFVIDGTAFTLKCNDAIGDETSKTCLRVLKSLRLEEP